MPVYFKDFYIPKEQFMRDFVLNFQGFGPSGKNFINI
jgi:hypothetical protein